MIQYVLLLTWGGFTLLYVFFTLLGTSIQSSLFAAVTYALGLFVPVGVGTVGGAFTLFLFGGDFPAASFPLNWVRVASAILLLAGAAWYGDRLLSEFTARLPIKLADLPIDVFLNGACDVPIQRLHDGCDEPFLFLRGHRTIEPFIPS